MSVLSTSRPTLPNDQNASGRNFDAKELDALEHVLASGTLTSTKGSYVKNFEHAFAEMLGVKHAFACASGSAAVHCAIAALDLEPGDEVVTTAITDMGALAPILYQAAIPVFADVDPQTYNVTAATIEAALSPRTRAIVVTHLFGNPCDMDAILAMAERRGIPVIEDAAQAFGTRYRGKPAGTLGTIGAFSLQQGKHITCGEGGVVVTDDDALARRIFLFINKAWGYGDAQPDHYFLALNYRLSELQGAVAYAQLGKLERHIAARQRAAAELARVGNLAGIETPQTTPNGEHSYWKYAIRIDPAIYPGGPAAFAKELASYDVASVPRYIQKPAFECAVFKNRKTFGASSFPFTLARREALDYTPSRYPGTYEALAHVLVLPLNERYEAEHCDYVVQSIERAAALLEAGR